MLGHGDRVYNVMDYGATGDGRADDTAAIRRAIDQLGPSGGTLYFPTPPASYAIATGLTVPVSGVTVCGDGASSQIVARFSGASAKDFVFAAQNVDDVTIRDLRITGTHAGGIRMHNGRRCRILRVEESGAILFNTQGFCAGIYVSVCDNLVIDGCALSGNGSTIGESHSDICCNAGSEMLTNSRITNNRCLSAPSTPWAENRDYAPGAVRSRGGTNYVCRSPHVSERDNEPFAGKLWRNHWVALGQDAGAAQVNFNICIFDPLGVLVQGNECAGAVESPTTDLRFGYGILLYKTNPFTDAQVGECRVIDNHVHDVKGAGIYLQSMRDTIVANNVVRRAGGGQSDHTLSVAGIVLESPTVGGISCTGNRVLDCPKDGISVSSLTKSVVSANVVSNSGRNGIGIRGVCSDVIIANNQVSSTDQGVGIGMFSDTAATRISILGNRVRSRVTPLVGYGIHLTEATSRCMVANNDVSDYDAGRAYALRGSNHTFIQNTTDGIQN